MSDKWLVIKVPENQKGCEGCKLPSEMEKYYKDCQHDTTTCPIYNGVEVEEVKVDLFGGEFQGIESIKTGHTYFDPKLFAVKQKEGK